MMISIREYAEKHGKKPETLRFKVRNGDFKTTVRIGNDWYIDSDEPYVDKRVKTGEYRNWRKTGKKQQPDK